MQIVSLRNVWNEMPNLFSGELCILLEMPRDLEFNFIMVNILKFQTLCSYFLGLNFVFM